MIGPFGNPDGLRSLATALRTAGTNVSTNASSLGGKVGVLTASKWTGGAAAAFQTHWNGEYTGMVDLGLSGTTIARVLDDLATSLDQANQIVLQAAAQAAAQVAVGTAAVNPVGGVASAASTMAAAMQRATQIAQRAWALATSQLSGVTVPTIGTLTSPQQAAAWAQNQLASPPTFTSLTFRSQNGDWQQNKRPPFPPILPPFDPALDTGGTWQPGQTQIVPGPFPGGGWITLQPSFNANGGIAIRDGGGGQVGGTGIDWKWLAVAGVLAALAALGAYSLTHPAQGPLNGQAGPTILPAYISPPNSLPAFPNAVRAKPKTPYGGGLRKRWVLPDGRILEWDYQHGTVEMYDKRGRHLGEYDANTGQQTKPPDPSRRITP